MTFVMSGQRGNLIIYSTYLKLLSCLSVLFETSSERSPAEVDGERKLYSLSRRRFSQI